MSEPSPPGSGAALGYLEVLGAAVLWGSAGVFAVTLFRQGASPAAVALLRPVVGLRLPRDAGPGLAPVGAPDVTEGARVDRGGGRA